MERIKHYIMLDLLKDFEVKKKLEILSQENYEKELFEYYDGWHSNNVMYDDNYRSHTLDSFELKDSISSIDNIIADLEKGDMRKYGKIGESIHGFLCSLLLTDEESALYYNVVDSRHGFGVGSFMSSPFCGFGEDTREKTKYEIKQEIINEIEQEKFESLVHSYSERIIVYLKKLKATLEIRLKNRLELESNPEFIRKQEEEFEKALEESFFNEMRSMGCLHNIGMED